MFGKKKKIIRKKNVFQDYFEAILFAFVVAMIIRNWTFQNFKIPSGSMKSTLLIGDYLVANKLKYFFDDPKRGDIVTFRYPADPKNPNDITSKYSSYYLEKGKYIPILPPLYYNTEKSFGLRNLTAFNLTYYAKKNVVKRVIGMPGDEIEIKDNVVYINGEEFFTGKEQFVDFETFERYKMIDGEKKDLLEGQPKGKIPFEYGYRYLITSDMPKEDYPKFLKNQDLKLSENEVRVYSVLDKDAVQCKWDSDNDGIKDEIGSRNNLGPITVPEEKYFVLGDNRDNSADSRFWGFVERDEITGTPSIIFFSKDDKTGKNRFDRIFKLIK